LSFLIYIFLSATITTFNFPVALKIVAMKIKKHRPNSPVLDDFHNAREDAPTVYVYEY